MIRNEKTGRFEPAEKKDEGYGYYSKVLSKPFDSVEELKEAEGEYLKAEEEKKKASLAKKAEATKVEDAWKALNAAKKAYNEKVLAAKKECLRKIADEKKAYGDLVKAEDEILAKAESAYDEALSEFTKAHPEGYHVTLKDGDRTATIARSSVSSYDWVDGVFDSFLKIFNNF